MACISISRGINTSCDLSLGGLKTVYIANYDDVTSIKEKDGQIVGITMASGKKFYEFRFKKNTASMTSTLNVSDNGNNISTDVSLSFQKQDTEKRLAISALSMSELVVIVADANGKYWYLGRDFSVTASAGGAESGTAFTDVNRYTITLQDISLDYPYEVAVDPDTTGGEHVDLDSLVEKLV